MQKSATSNSKKNDDTCHECMGGRICGNAETAELS